MSRPASASSLYLKQLEIGPMQNFVYLIGDREARECLVVDPAWDVPAILAEAEKDGMKVAGALVTHSHYDHVNGVADLLQATDGKVYVNREEAEFLKRSRAASTGIFINIGSPNLVPVESGDRIKVGAVEVEFLHTPGHTPGSQCFLVRRNLVAGDTLFIGYCGRCDLPGGDPEKMYASLTQKLAKLDDDIVLYPGHNYSDKPAVPLGEEKRTNPYLGARSLPEFYKAMSGLLD
jgi:glyoxylase-like metal-dependent hydrolase (beta-lactamase superfamily II)